MLPPYFTAFAASERQKRSLPQGLSLFYLYRTLTDADRRSLQGKTVRCEARGGIRRRFDLRASHPDRLLSVERKRSYLFPSLLLQVVV